MLGKVDLSAERAMEGITLVNARRMRKRTNRHGPDVKNGGKTAMFHEIA
jgi:hypothetical protein